MKNILIKNDLLRTIDSVGKNTTDFRNNVHKFPAGKLANTGFTVFDFHNALLEEIWELKRHLLQDEIQNANCYHIPYLDRIYTAIDDKNRTYIGIISYLEDIQLKIARGDYYFCFAVEGLISYVRDNIDYGYNLQRQYNFREVVSPSRQALKFISDTADDLFCLDKCNLSIDKLEYLRKEKILLKINNYCRELRKLDGNNCRIKKLGKAVKKITQTKRYLLKLTSSWNAGAIVTDKRTINKICILFERLNAEITYSLKTSREIRNQYISALAK